MDMILVRLRPGEAAAARHLSPQVATDILWANAIAADRLEHIRARPAPEPEPDAIDLALFHRTDPAHVVDRALDLCLRAIRGSPALAGWSATAMPGPRDATPPG